MPCTKNILLLIFPFFQILFSHGLHGILADEMGLGKTIQIIALICLLISRKIKGHFLIVCPLSTLSNWQSEFKKFAPKVTVEVFYADKTNRPLLKKNIASKLNVCQNVVILTTYQTVELELSYFSSTNWMYLIVDEGHKLKNHKSQIFQ